MKKTTRITETATIVDRIAALESTESTGSTKHSKYIHGLIFKTMLEEYKDRLDYLNSHKEYMVHFKGGGWNTAYGVDEESAFTAAQLTFEEPGKDTCIVESVRLATKSGIEAAMRLFY
jgi:hypothetical protein